MAGGNSGGVESYLPIAAALAATIATDGAASPWLVDAMGATAAGAVTSGAAAAAASGLTAAVTGQDVGRSALMGGVSGGIGGALSGYSAAANAGTTGTTTATTATTAAPLTGGNVAGTAALSPEAYMSGASGTFVPSAGYSATLPSGLGATANAMTPSMVNFANSTTDPIGAVNYMANATPAEIQAATGPGAQAATSTASSGVGNWLANNKGIAALGGTALMGALIQNDNKKYGTPSTETYNGPLSQFHYDPKKYTPVTTPQPSPAYQAKYPNYVQTPYNPYAATGAQGGVVAMASGGITMANPSVGPVEQMSRDNAMGNNQMFPQAGINSPSFASATNTPMGNNIIASDTAVDPYSGAQRFAEGGTTEAPQAQAPIPLQDMPNFITQNSVATNNALTQDLVSRMAARNAMNPAPDQVTPVAPVQPAGIMAAAPTPYTTPTFTRPNVAPVSLNPTWIQGTPAQQAKAAADAEAQRLADLAAASFTGGSDGSTTGAGGGAGGGLMPNALRYAVGGGIQSHLGGYSDGGRLLKGPGDGMSDNIPATIGHKQPARLADGEFVVPADVVSHLGNGSTDAGAKKLYAMMDKVRAARTGNKKQGKQIKAEKYLKV